MLEITNTNSHFCIFWKFWGFFSCIWELILKVHVVLTKRRKTAVYWSHVVSLCRRWWKVKSQPGLEPRAYGVPYKRSNHWAIKTQYIDRIWNTLIPSDTSFMFQKLIFESDLAVLTNRSFLCAVTSYYMKHIFFLNFVLSWLTSISLCIYEL